MIWHPSISLTLYLSILRSADQLRLVVPKSRQRPGGTVLFQWWLLSLWNELPTHVKMAPTLDTFKSHLKTHFHSLAFNTAWELCGLCLSFTIFLYLSVFYLILWFFNCLLYAFNLLYLNFNFLYFTVLYLLCSTLVTLLFFKCAIQIKWIGLDWTLLSSQWMPYL